MKTLLASLVSTISLSLAVAAPGQAAQLDGCSLEESDFAPIVAPILGCAHS